MTDADRACLALQLASTPADWSERWAQSEASFNPEALSFLHPAFVGQACRKLGIGPEVAAALADAAQAAGRDPIVARLAWHCHWLLFRSGLETQAGRWPVIPPGAHPAGPMFYAVVFLSGLPCIERIERARGIAPEVTMATLADLEVWILEHKRRYGYLGFRELGWLLFHFQGRMHRLGRLQYLPGRFADHFRFFRHAVTHRVAALAEDGLNFRDDGQFSSADGGTQREGAWRSRFIASEAELQGNPLCPLGHVLKPPVTLNPAVWHEILRPGDPVMTVHIAATGPLDQEACGASFQQAVAFFADHFPDWPYRAFTCESWLLDPQLERLTPGPAKILDFLREWFLHPVENASEAQTLERVFSRLDGQRPDLTAAPQHSSLQRAMLSAMAAGERFRSGGGVLFPDDLDWGTQSYRRPE